MFGSHQLSHEKSRTAIVSLKGSKTPLLDKDLANWKTNRIKINLLYIPSNVKYIYKNAIYNLKVKKKILLIKNKSY